MDKFFTIKQAAEYTGLSASNIRYYEKEGLLGNIVRNNANVRLFSQKDIDWICFLAKLKDMEMPVELMKYYAVLRAQGDRTIRERIELLNTHKQHMLNKIEQLKNNLVLLEHKIKVYMEMERNINE